MKQKDNKKINNKELKKRKQLIWTIKITIASFFISTLFGVLSQTAANKANVYILVFILLLFVFINIFFDGVAISVTTCDLKSLNSMAAQKVKNADIAVKLCKNGDKVASISADVVGDIAGILSGVCLGAIVLEIVKLAKISQDIKITVISATISGVISAITIGGKAFMKSVAMAKNLQYVMVCATIISIFKISKKKKEKKKNARKNNK